MAKLTQCIHCNHAVSSEAATCPSCGKFPREQVPSGAPSTTQYGQEDSYQCPTCQTILSPESFRFQWTSVMGLGSESIQEWQQCPKCHQPFRAKKCSHCGKGIFEGTEKTVRKETGSAFYHPSCFRLAKKPLASKSDKQGCAGAIYMIVLACLTILVCIVVSATGCIGPGSGSDKGMRRLRPSWSMDCPMTKPPRHLVDYGYLVSGESIR
jgi:hypothetical protein